MNENTLISIEIIGGEKWIHYLGFGYDTGSKEEKSARWVDYTGLYCKLSEALNYGISKWEADNQEYVTQYIEDLTSVELEERYKSYDYDALIFREYEIEQDTPCGLYFVVAN